MTQIDLEKVLAIHLWANKNNQFKRISSIKFIQKFIWNSISIIYNCVLIHPFVIVKNNGQNKILFIRAHSRNDLDKHSKIYESAVENVNICVLSKKIRKIDFFTLPKVLLNLWKIRKSIIFTYKKSNISPCSQEGIEIFNSLFLAVSDCIKLLPHIIACKQIISFQEMVPVENLICQVSNALEKQTFSLQHALGAYSEKGSYESKYSRIHYESSVCKTILVWGGYSKISFEKFTSSKIVLIGKPYLPNIKEFVDGYTFVFEADTNINNKLLILSNEIEARGYPVSRWFRPGHKLAIEAGCSRKGPLRKFIIGWRSSLLVELGFLGGNVFVIPDSVFSNVLPPYLVVNNVDALENRFENLEEYPNEVWKQFIDCTGDESIKRFKKSIENFV